MIIDLRSFNSRAVKLFILMMVMIFSLNSVQAIQTKDGTLKKKKAAKQRKYKKPVKNPNHRHNRCEVVNCPYNPGRRWVINRYQDY